MYIYIYILCFYSADSSHTWCNLGQVWVYARAAGLRVVEEYSRGHGALQLETLHLHLFATGFSLRPELHSDPKP